MLHNIILFLEPYMVTWFHWVHDWGYLGIIILMAMESSIFPVPSELVIPPAAILASQGGNMSITGVIIAGTIGSWIGSAITYWVALAIGRPIVMRYGRFFLMPPAKVEKAERFMHRYEAGGIFFARLLPVLRHLISIPAGIIRMDFLKFSNLTIAGALIWCWVLAALGGKVGKTLSPQDMEALKTGKDVKIHALIDAVKGEAKWILVAIGVVCVLYFVAMRLSSAKKA